MKKLLIIFIVNLFAFSSLEKEFKMASVGSENADDKRKNYIAIEPKAMSHAGIFCSSLDYQQGNF